MSGPQRWGLVAFLFSIAFLSRVIASHFFEDVGRSGGLPDGHHLPLREGRLLTQRHCLWVPGTHSGERNSLATWTKSASLWSEVPFQLWEQKAGFRICSLMTLHPTSLQYVRMKFGRTDGFKQGPEFQKEAFLSADSTIGQRSKVSRNASF